MDISKEIRHEIYIEVLDLYLRDIETNTFRGFCWVFTEILETKKDLKIFDGSIEGTFYTEEIQKLFPEIFVYKPTMFYNFWNLKLEVEAYWFPRTDTEIRISILKEAIELTK
jgi:hypothetical protein